MTPGRAAGGVAPCGKAGAGGAAGGVKGAVAIVSAMVGVLPTYRSEKIWIVVWRRLRGDENLCAFVHLSLGDRHRNLSLAHDGLPLGELGSVGGNLPLVLGAISI